MTELSAKTQSAVSEPLRRMRVNPVTLSFEKECAEYEKLFNQAYLKKSLKPLRIAIVLAIITWSSFGFLDIHLDPQNITTFWAIRFGFIVPMFLIGLAISYTRFFENHMQPFVAVSAIAAGLAVIAMIPLGNTPIRHTYYTGLILVFLFAYTILRLKFKWASLSCWLLVVTYEIVAVRIDTPLDILINNNFFFINANVIGMFACYYIELSYRRDFFLARRLEEEKKKVSTVNQELEENVQKRTLQIIKINEDLNLTLNDYKRAQEGLKKSEEKYRTIITNMEEGYYELDLEANFTFCNDSALRIFRHDAENTLVGNNIRSYMTDDHAEQALRAFNAIYQTNIPEKAMNWEIQTPDGATCFLEVSAVRIDNAEGRPQGFRGIIRDITERKKMEKKILEYYENIKATRTMTILGLAKLAEYRDLNTGEHLERMMEYTRILTQTLAEHPKYRSYITSEYIEDIYISSILHDIGKVGITDEILLKPGKLTPEEFEKVKEHPVLGGDALRAMESRVTGKSFLTLGKEICYHHHERWDGSGYPGGLSGERIPLSARIVALVDVYDALTTVRVYKGASSHEEAVETIINERGKHFDPDIVDTFLAKQDVFKKLLEAAREDAAQQGRKALN